MELLEPVSRLTGDDTLIRMPGIGGTGVVTISQILQMAAHLDGGHAAGLEQTGLAQKGGPVVSDLRFSAKPLTGALRASRGRADVRARLRPARRRGRARPCRSPSPGARSPCWTRRSCRPRRWSPAGSRCPARRTRRSPASSPRPTRPANLYLDAQGLSQRLFADHMPANMLLVGAAFQHGCLPMSAAAIERAIELNGAAVATNLAAFRWGRAAALDPAAVAAATAPSSAPTCAVGADRAEASSDRSVRTASCTTCWPPGSPT